MPQYRSKCVKLLESRGVRLGDICDVARFLQDDYHKSLKTEDMLPPVLHVLNKREVQYAIMVAVELDVLAEEKKLKNKTLQKILISDEGLFGIDEVVAYSICNLYGSIALTNFGFVDREKIGIIRKLNCDGKGTGVCNTFIDDIVGAIAASAAAHYAHGTSVRRDD